MDRQNGWIGIREQTDVCTGFHREGNGEKKKVELIQTYTWSSKEQRSAFDLSILIDNQDIGAVLVQAAQLGNETIDLNPQTEQILACFKVSSHNC